MQIIAHRGGAGLGPENTLLAMRRALEHGIRWLELDVYAVDGEVVVFHDLHLERTTNGSGPLPGSSIAYLRSLDAGAGERIPLLSEVLDLVAGRAGLNVELKGGGSAEPTVALLQRYVAEGRLRWDDLLLSSFDQRELLRAHRLEPQLPVGVLYAGVTLHWPEDCRALGARTLNLAEEAVDAAVVDAVHAQGLQVWVYTVNDPGEATRLAALGVDALFSDEPQRLLPLTTER